MAKFNPKSILSCILCFPEPVSKSHSFLSSLQSPVSSLNSLLLIILTFSILNAPSFSATFTWSGLAAGNSNWGNNDNWVEAGRPAPTGDDLIFAGTTDLTNDNNQVTSANSITFDNTAGGFTLQGAAITLIGDVTNNSTEQQIIEFPITLSSGTHNFDNASAGLRLHGVISGSGNLVKTGSSLLLLDNNTYTGTTTINDGSLYFGNETSAGGISNSSNVVNNGTLIIRRNNVYTYTGTISGSGRVVFLGSGTITLGDSNSYTGETEIKKGIAIISSLANVNSGASSLGNPADATEGTIQLAEDTDATLRYIGTGHSTDRVLNFEGPAGMDPTLENAGTGTLTFSSDFTVTGAGAKTLTLTGTHDGVISGLIPNGTAIISLIKDGTGTWTLSGDNTYTGTTTVSDGTLQIGDGGTSGTIINTGSITNNSEIIFDRSNDDAYLGNITGTGNFTKNGSGTLTLGSSLGNQWTGTTTINAGTLALNQNAGDVYSSIGWTIASGATLYYQLGASSQHSINNRAVMTVNTGGTYDLNGGSEALGYVAGGGNITNLGNNLTLDLPATGDGSDFSGVISGPGYVEIRGNQGSGTQIFSGLNTYTGKTILEDGTLSVSTLANGGVSSNIGASGNAAGNLEFDGGTLKYTGGDFTIDRLFSLNVNGGTFDATSATGVPNFNNSGSVSLIGSGDRTLTFNIEQNTYISPVISDPVTGTTSITKTGSAILILRGANTNTGDLTITEGMVSFEDNGTVGGNIVHNGSNLQWNSTTDVTYSGIISGTGRIEKVNSNTVRLARDNTFTGTTTINGGTLHITEKAIANSLTNTVTVNNGGTLSFGRQDVFIRHSGTVLTPIVINEGGVVTNDGGHFNALATLTLVGGTLTSVDGRSNVWPAWSLKGTVFVTANSTISGSGNTNDAIHLGGGNDVTGTTFNVNSGVTLTVSTKLWDGRDNADAVQVSSLTKTGNGTMTLTGTNTYTGTTSVSDGTLNVTGSLASGSTVIVASGGTLTGDGTINGQVTVNGGAVLSPGNATGTLNTGKLILQSGASVNMELGTSSDQVAITGDFTLDGTLNVTDVTGFDNGTYTLMTYSGNLNDNSLELGSMPPYFSYSISAGEGKVDLIVSEGMNPADWSNSKSFTLNTSASGADVAGNVMDFPVLMRITDDVEMDMDQALSGGDDIRFVNDKGIILPFEIEEWADGISAAIWVLVDTVYGNDENQSLTMYWGNASAPGRSDGREVFETTNGFAGVWHMGDDAANPRVTDAMENNHGTLNENTDSHDITGVIDGGLEFDGNDAVTNPGFAPAMNGLSEFSVSLWASATVYVSNTAALSINDGGLSGESLIIYPYDNSAGNGTRIWFNGGAMIDLNGQSLADGNFHQFAFVSRSATDHELYIDGVPSGNSNIDKTLDSHLDQFNIGTWDNATQYFTGRIDEVRVSNTARSADWIKLSYENQREGSGFISENTGPVLGVDIENLIPATHVEQVPNGTGTVNIGFRAKTLDGSDTHLSQLRYNTGFGWINIDPDSPALAAGWMSVNYSTATDLTGTLHTLSLITGQIPELAGRSFGSVEFSLKAPGGNNALTESIALDNEFPNVSLTNQVTPITSPEISGISSEPLLQATVTLEGNDYNAQVDSVSFSVPAGIVPDLDNGTYDVSVTATDLMGNVSTENFTGALTINTEAPAVSVNPVLTNQVSPGLSGTVNKNDATVTVTIGGESHAAQVSSGKWSIEPGTFLFLSEGTWDVVVQARLGELTGLDPSSNELVIDLTPPVPIATNLITNSINPGLTGTVSESVDSLFVTLNNQRIPATLSDLDWQVAAGPFSGIIEGIYPIVIVTSDPAGNNVVDSTYSLVVDRTNPQSASFSPNRIKTTLLPQLRLELNEPVVAGEGSFLVMKSSDSTLHQAVSAATASGQGSNTLTLSLSDSLDEMSSYHVLVNADAVMDLAGNVYAGVPDSSIWNFETAAANATFISSVTSSNPPGVYPVDSVINFTLIFTDVVTLSGGNLNIKIETGLVDSVIVIPPFTNQDQLEFSYTVGFGDFARVLDIISLSLDSGAALLNDQDHDVVLDIGNHQNLSSHVLISLDGIPLSVGVIHPISNELTDNARVSFTLSKNIASGSVNWLQVDATGTVDEDDLLNITRSFTDDMLSAGSHINKDLDAGVTQGLTYNVTITVTDSAGTTIVSKVSNVRIGATVSSIQLLPSITRYRLNEKVQFRIYDAVSGTQVTGGVVWNLEGEGTLDTLGNFKATHIGNTRVIATLGSLITSIDLSVREGSIPIPDNSIEIIYAADNLRIQPHTALAANTFLSFSFVDPRTTIDFDLVGPDIAFSSFAVDSMTISIKADTSFLDTSTGKEFGVYQLVDEEQGIWKWIPAQTAGEWTSFAVVNDTLGTYILARLKEPPTIEVLPGSLPVEGQDLQVLYIAGSTIENPGVSLEYLEGGSPADTLAADYQKGDTAGAAIPGASVSTNGLVYRVEVKDGTHTVVTDYREVNVTNVNDVPFPVELLQNIYQSFSLPMNHNSYTVEDLLMDEWGAEDRSFWRLYEYNGDFLELTKRSLLKTGSSYWFKMTDQTPTITILAGSAQSVPLISGNSISLHQGWNMFANPYVFPLTLSHLQTANGGEALVVYAYPVEDNYTPLDADSPIEPYKGYIIWNGPADNPVLSNLKFSALDTGNFAIAPLTKPAQSRAGHNINLTLTGEYSSNGQLTVRWNTSGARQGYDKLDLPKPGSINSRVSLDLRVPWSEQGYLQDTRGALGSGQSWRMTTRATRKNEPLTLTLTGAQQVKGDHRAFLLDDTRINIHELKPESTRDYTFTAHTKKEEEFELIIGNHEYIKQKLLEFNALVRTFGLGQNYPNPFHTATTIKYQVHVPGPGKTANVRLDIYNLKGRLLTTLVNQKHTRGKYHIIWDGTDLRNIPVPTGTYIYTLRSGSNVMYKKLILLR